MLKFLLFRVQLFYTALQFRIMKACAFPREFPFKSINDVVPLKGIHKKTKTL